MKFGCSIICPKCGLSGFATIRNVRSSYTPNRSKVVKAIKSSLYTTDTGYKFEKNSKSMRIDQWEYWTNSIIRGPTKNDAYIKEVQGRGKGNSSYTVYTKTYYHIYIGHYDRNEYGLKKIDYDKGSLRSRPNGRKWCYVPKDTVLSIAATMDNAGFTISYDDLKKKLLT